MKVFMRHPRRRARGMTLIELLVAMAIGLIVTLAVTTLVTVGEAQKRTALATNDMGQSGSYAAYVIDRAVRSAGSGVVQSWNLGAFGCRLSATRTSAGQVLPRTSAAFPAPFAGLLGGAGATATAGSGSLRFAPLLIGKGQGTNSSDILVVMGGNAAAGDVPRPIRAGVAGTNNLRLDNTIGLMDGDLVMVSQDGVQDCLIEQVSDNPPGTLNTSGNDVVTINGTYVTPTGLTTSLSTLAGSSAAYLTTLGNVNASSANPDNVNANNVQLQLIGVTNQRTLVSYDLLRSAGTGLVDNDALQPLADGVIGLYALYGVDTDNDGKVDSWIDPGATGYDIATVMTTPATMRKILAVRVALVLQSSIPQLSTQQNTSTADLTAASPSSITLFGDRPAAVQRTVSSLDTNYRYRVVDTTIPLRNMLLLP